MALCVPAAHNALRLIHSTGEKKKDWKGFLDQSDGSVLEMLEVKVW